MIHKNNNFFLYESAEQVAIAAANHIANTARAAIHTRGCFRIVLAGGQTPLAAYRLLNNYQTNWKQWQIFFGDERCLEQNHPERNSYAIAAAWLNHVAIPASNQFVIPAEHGSQPAAAQYAAWIQTFLPFDLVLLGMGEDGHTASLFPGHNIYLNKLVIPVTQAPKPPAERVSLTPQALTSSRQILILITGANKHLALQQWRQGVDLPIAQVAARGKHVRVLLDQGAAAG